MNKIDYTERAKIYAEAEKTFGRAHQLIVALEELSEAQKEICKLLRGGGSLLAIADEIADATIVLEQVRLMVDINEEVCRAMDFKVARLKLQIEEKTGEGNHELNRSGAPTA